MNMTFFSEIPKRKAINCRSETARSYKRRCASNVIAFLMAVVTIINHRLSLPVFAPRRGLRLRTHGVCAIYLCIMYIVSRQDLYTEFAFF